MTCAFVSQEIPKLTTAIASNQKTNGTPSLTESGISFPIAMRASATMMTIPDPMYILRRRRLGTVGFVWLDLVKRKIDIPARVRKKTAADTRWITLTYPGSGPLGPEKIVIESRIRSPGPGASRE